MPEGIIHLDSFESRTGQVGTARQEGGGGGRDEGDDGVDGGILIKQRVPYCPGVNDLTLPVYKYVGYKPHTSNIQYAIINQYIMKYIYNVLLD